MIRLMQKLINKKPSGITSLLLVLAIGLTLTVIVAGITTLSIRETQKASSVESSNKALNAAESAIKLAVQKLVSDPNYQQTDCAIPAGDTTYSSLTTEAQITCLTVKSVFTTTYESLLQKNRATQLAFGTIAGSSVPKYLQLRWQSKTLDTGNLPPDSNYQYEGNLYPEVYQTKPASMEITMYYWPNSSKALGDAKSVTIFLVPGKADAGYSAASPRTQVTNYCDKPGVNPPAGLEMGDYRCAISNSNTGFDIRAAMGLASTATIDNLVLRIKPRYLDTHFELSAFSSSDVNSKVNIKSTKAQIDVTTKVGNTYRRVKAEKPISALAVESIFDSVVYSGKGVDDNLTTNICKDQVITLNAGTYYKAPLSISTPRCSN